MYNVEEEKIFITPDDHVHIYVLLVTRYHWIVRKNAGILGGNISDKKFNTFDSFIQAKKHLDLSIKEFIESNPNYIDVKNSNNKLSLQDSWLNQYTYLDYKDKFARKKGDCNVEGRHIYDRKIYTLYSLPQNRILFFTLVYEKNNFYLYVQYSTNEKLHTYLQHTSEDFDIIRGIMFSIIAEFDNMKETQLAEKEFYSQMINCGSDLSFVPKKDNVDVFDDEIIVKIKGNGERIEGLKTQKILTVDKSFSLLYVDHERGWEVVPLRIDSKLTKLKVTDYIYVDNKHHYLINHQSFNSHIVLPLNVVEGDIISFIVSDEDNQKIKIDYYKVICVNNMGMENNFKLFYHYYAKFLNHDLFMVWDNNNNPIECIKERFEIL